jgi:hypothetical protein
MKTNTLINRPDFDSRTVNKVLKNFISQSQLKTLIDLSNNSEESEFFADKIMELVELITNMPRTYETEGIEIKNKKVVLHYFNHNSHAYIVEKDIENKQHQAWGLMQLNDWEPETGYISIQELIENGFELDLYWDEKTIGEIKNKS